MADWYAGWSGPHGSNHHRLLAIPALLDLLEPQPDEAILDLGCGPGPLAPAILRRRATYVGVDLSPRLVAVARRTHGEATFLVADATALHECRDIVPSSFAAATFLLSLQDIDPLEAAIASAAHAVMEGGRVVAVLTHPCFRVPRQSGWGFDDRRKLRYRRINRYLGRLAVPMQPHAGGRGSTRSYHRPLGDYVAALSANGFVIDAMREIADTAPAAGRARADTLSDSEIPLFLAIRARKLGPPKVRRSGADDRRPSGS